MCYDLSRGLRGVAVLHNHLRVGIHAGQIAPLIFQLPVGRLIIGGDMNGVVDCRLDRSAQCG